MVISDLWNAITDSGPAAVVLIGATLGLFGLPIAGTFGEVMLRSGLTRWWSDLYNHISSV